jgi:hypothetical protein
MRLIEARALLRALLLRGRKSGLDKPQLECILFSSFLLGLSFPKSPGSLFGSPAISPTKRRPLGFAPPPHDGFAFLAAPSRRRKSACVALNMTGKEGVVKG